MSFKRSFVFLNIKSQKIEYVIDELLKLNRVKEVHVITGKKDLLVVLETKIAGLIAGLEGSSGDIANYVIEKIGKINFVEKTETIVPSRSEIKV
jgi:DNA-binding Lrp family transcriptional regulator